MQVSDFKQELLFAAGVGEERITEFSCGEWPILQKPQYLVFSSCVLIMLALSDWC